MGYPRLEYNSIKVDFSRHFNELEVYPKETKTRNQSSSGLVETIDFFEQWFIYALKHRLDAGEVEQLRKWYNYVKAGASFKFWSDRDLGIYTGFEGKSATSNNGLAATFARSGVAKYWDESTNELEEVAENTARFPGGKYGSGLLIEGGSENICLKSEQFNDAAWTAVNITVNANTVETPDPEGGATADNLTANAGNGTLTQDVAVAITTNDGCFSVYLKARNYIANGVKLYIKDSTGATLATSTISPTTEWERYSVAHESAANNANNWRLVIEIVNNGYIYYAWGAQLEVGTYRIYPSSYIETNAAAVTRSDESCYYAITNGLQISQLKGTISFWVYVPYDYNESGGTQPVRTYIQVTNAASDAVMEIHRSNNGHLRAYFYDAGGSAGNACSGSASGMTQNAWNHIVATWDMTLTDVAMSLYLNGSLLSAPSLAGITLRIPTRIYIGSDATPATHADAIFDDLIVTTDCKDAGWVARTYSSQYAQGYNKNYFASVRLNDSEFNPLIHVGGNKYDFELNAEEVLT